MEEETTTTSSLSLVVVTSLFTNKIWPIMYKLGTIIVGLVVAAGGLLYIKQESLLYFPEIGGIPRKPEQNPRGYRNPNERGIMSYESHRITCDDNVQIHSWYLPYNDDNSRQNQQNQNQQTPSIIFFHGNAGNIGLRLPNAIQMLTQLQANIWLIEYRGYGNSDSATPTEKGLKLDSEAAFRYVVQYHQQQQQLASKQQSSTSRTPIFVFGRSLGGSVALHMSLYAQTQNSPNSLLTGVIVENTFTSISDMVDVVLPILKPIKQFVLRMSWDSTQIVSDLKNLPILFLAGAKDELVPHSHMQQMYQLAKQQSIHTQMHIIPNGTHNESWLQGGPEYWEAIRQFMSKSIIRIQQEQMNSQQQHPTFSSTTQKQTSTTTTSTTATSYSSLDSNTIDTGGTTAAKSSIPIMPSKFMDIAKDAVGIGSSSSSAAAAADDDRKKEL